jgi:hypothetical protein
MGEAPTPSCPSQVCDVLHLSRAVRGKAWVHDDEGPSPGVVALLAKDHAADESCSSPQLGATWPRGL